MALLTIEKKLETEMWELCKNFARTLQDFYRGTLDFRHMGVLVSRICTIFYVESVLEIFASFTVITYVSNMYESIHLD